MRPLFIAFLVCGMVALAAFHWEQAKRLLESSNDVIQNINKSEKRSGEIRHPILVAKKIKYTCPYVYRGNAVVAEMEKQYRNVYVCCLSGWRAKLVPNVNACYVKHD